MRIRPGARCENGHPHVFAAAQEAANLLVNSVITGILNLSPIVLSLPEEVIVNNVNLALELENLNCFIRE
jgi:redox-sensing transcriptional repressor